MKILGNKYFKLSLAIILYVITMELIGPYLIVPLVKWMFNLDFYESFLSFTSNRFSYFSKEALGVMNIMNVYLQTLIYVINAGFLIIILYSFLKKDFLLYKENEGKIVNTLGIGVLVYFGVSISINVLVLILGKLLGSNPESLNQNAIVELFNNDWLCKIAMIVTTVLIGPLVEELVFRKAIFGLIPNGILAIILSSISFGLLHTLSFGYNPVDLLLVTLPYMGAGISFGWVYYKSENIYASYLLHAGLNLISVLMILL